MNWKITFQVAATYVGAVMGAGFASGQEIQQFFVNFEYWGLIGITVSATLFAILGWIMIDLQNRWRISSYLEFFKKLMGDAWGYRLDLVMTALLFMGMVAMLSGAGALFHQFFDLNIWLGIILTSGVIGLALWYGGEGLLWINSVLIPFKFLFCFGIALFAIFMGSQGDGEGVVFPGNPLIQNWFLSSILYVSFNLTLGMVVFASLGAEIRKPGARIGAVMGGFALGIFAFVIGLALIRFPEVKTLEIPMVAVAGRMGQWPAFLYVFVLWLAMITAAINNGFSLATRLVKAKKQNYQKVALLVLLAVIPLAGVKFSFLVKFVYPLFGYLGLIFLPLLFIAWRKT